MAESLSDAEAIARWKKGMKGEGSYKGLPPLPPHFRFVDGWPAEIMQKAGHMRAEEKTPIDPWGQRHRR